MKPAGPVRPSLTQEEREWIVHTCYETLGDPMFWVRQDGSMSMDKDGVDEMVEYGPEMVRHRDSVRYDGYMATRLLNKLDYPEGQDDYVTRLRWVVEGDVEPPIPPVPTSGVE